MAEAHLSSLDMSSLDREESTSGDEEEEEEEKKWQSASDTGGSETFFTSLTSHVSHWHVYQGFLASYNSLSFDRPE